MSDISGYLNDIANAIYGEQVRSAIHDAIQACYTDVESGQTTAEAAANYATGAADSALAAAASAADAISLATGAANEAAEAASNANAAASSAYLAASAASTAVNQVDSAISSVNAVISDANDVISAASSILNSADIVTGQARLASEFANAAGSTANVAASTANDAADTATTAASDAYAAASDCNTARLEAITAANGASTAASRANLAASAIENITVSAEGVGPDDTASASVSTIDNHLNIHFRLKQGATGPKYIIKGDAYPSVAALEEAITSPAIGDQYNVGASAPYNVYRWTGTTWEDQGTIGISFDNLTNEEINTIWNETEIVSSTSKYINHTGLFHLIVNKIKAALTTKVDKVDGKGLSTNDFTDAYKNTVDENEAAVAALASSKVDKVTGKGLSTNDFTTALKTKLEGISAATSVPLMDGTASVGSATTYAKGDHVHPSDSTKVDKVDGKGLSTNDFTTALKTKLEGISAATSAPLMDGTASAGSAATFAKGDHVHPRDTFLQSKYGSSISANDDLNDYVETGNYYTSSVTIPPTLSNCPTTDTFLLEVNRYSPYSSDSSSHVRIVQYLHTVNTNEIFYRVKMTNTAGFGAWKIIYVKPSTGIPASDLVMDTELSSTSTNPVQNKVVNTAIYCGSTIPANTDLNNYIHTGKYYTTSNTSSLSNCPVSTVSGSVTQFILDVEGYSSNDNGNVVVQKIYVPSLPNIIYVRRKWSNTWYAWKEFVDKEKMHDEVSHIGTTKYYYIDSIRGSDSNTGLTFDDPLQSLDKLFSLCSGSDIRIAFINKSGTTSEMVYNTSVGYFSNMSIHFVNLTSQWVDGKAYSSSAISSEYNHQTSVRINFTLSTDIQFYDCYTHISGIKFSTTNNKQIYFDGGFTNHAGTTLGKDDPVSYQTIFNTGSFTAYNGVSVFLDGVTYYAIAFQHSRGAVRNLTVTSTDPKYNVVRATDSYITMFGTFNYSTATNPASGETVQSLIYSYYGELRFHATIPNRSLNRTSAIDAPNGFVYIPSAIKTAVQAKGTITATGGFVTTL